MLYEMDTKQAVELNEGNTYPWPVTQAEVADALGLTDVHVNRVICDLRLNGLVTVGRGSFVVHEWNGLKALGPVRSALSPSPRPLAASSEPNRSMRHSFSG